MRRSRSGTTLIEMLVSLLMTLVIGAALFSVFTNTYQMHDAAVGQGTTETAARTPIDDLADHLRDAQQYWNTVAGAQPTSVSQSSVIAAGTASSVTYYESNSSSDTVRYWLSGTNLERTVGGNTTVVLTNVQALTFTYYKAPSGSYNVDYNDVSLFTTTTNANQPSAAELPYLSQIGIDATVTIGGYTRELACVVRLRNSPYKVNL